MLKPLQTRYSGHRFRSRLEARWAVFLDACKIPWEYEPEGFDLGDGLCYLPDFWLPSIGCWMEIKGSAGDFDQDAPQKAAALAEQSERPVYIFYGGHVVPDSAIPEDTCSAQKFEPGGWDEGYFFCQCEGCGTLGIEFQARSSRLGCCEFAIQSHDRTFRGNSPTLIKAYQMARGVRFDGW